MTRLLTAIALVVAIAAAGGCRDDRGRPPPPDPARTRRVLEKPAGEVRAAPPHAIRSDGVGPYLLGAPMTDVLDLLPHGPRVTLLEIDNVLDYSLVRAENDRLLIGAQRPIGVAYVAVLDHEIARTEGGVGVGATGAELATALGAPVVDPQRLRDPRLQVFAAMPNVRFVVEADKVVAVLVGVEGRPRSPQAPAEPAPLSPAGAQPGPPPPPPRCTPYGPAADLVGAARFDAGDARVALGCLTQTEPLAVVTSGERFAVVVGEPTRPRRIVSETITGLQFAGPIDVDRDGRDEIGLVSRRSGDGGWTWRVEIYRFEQGKLVLKLSKDAYTIDERSAPPVGARPEDIELLLDIGSDGDAVRVGGLFVHNTDHGPSNVAPLSPMRYRWRTSEPEPEGNDAGVGDAGVEPAAPAGGSSAADGLPRRNR